MLPKIRKNLQKNDFLFFIIFELYDVQSVSKTIQSIQIVQNGLILPHFAIKVALDRHITKRKSSKKHFFRFFDDFRLVDMAVDSPFDCKMKQNETILDDLDARNCFTDTLDII